MAFLYTHIYMFKEHADFNRAQVAEFEIAGKECRVRQNYSAFDTGGQHYGTFRVLKSFGNGQLQWTPARAAPKPVLGRVRAAERLPPALADGPRNSLVQLQASPAEEVFRPSHQGTGAATSDRNASAASRQFAFGKICGFFQTWWR